MLPRINPFEVEIGNIIFSICFKTLGRTLFIIFEGSLTEDITSLKREK